MTQTSYRNFLLMVNAGSGPFSYVFAGMKMVCDPTIYVAVHGRAHIDAVLRAEVK
jgi:hypothetical protein